MAENDPKGFLYRWANDPATGTETVMRIPCEVYKRIVGYLRPKRSWNVGKLQEDADRQDYVLPKVIPEVLQ